MGAIAGMLRFDGGAPDGNQWRNAVEAIAQFGKAGTALHRSPGAAFAHAYNAFEARDPIIRDRSGRFTAVVSARIDDRVALQQQLDADESASDSQLILHAYGRWGDGCARRLRGDFVFAIFDADRHELFCARDPVGARPLFFHRTPRGFAFASTLELLRGLCGAQPELDEVALGASVLRLRRTPTGTIWHGLNRLPPASYLRVSAAGTRIVRYWEPTAVDPGCRTSDDWAHAARSALNAAVGDRLRQRSRVGVLLSGGLDSSSIAALVAAQPRAQTLRLAAAGAVLPTGYLGSQADEWDFMRHVATAFEFDVLALERDAGRDPLNPARFYSAFDRHGRPVNPFHAMDRALLSRLAEAGAQVALSGFWGDGTLSYAGEGWCAGLLRRGRWLDVLGLSRALARAQGQPASRLIRRELGSVLRSRLGPLRDFPARHVGRQAMMSSKLKEALRELVGIGDASERSPVAMLPGLLRQGFSFVEEQYLEASSLGVEAAFPFLDVRVVGLAMAVPPEQHVKGGVHRSLLRRAMRGCLPELIRTRRSKGAFIPGFTETLHRDADAFQREVKTLADTARGRIDGILDLGEMVAQLRVLASRPPAPGPETTRTLKLVQWLVAMRFLRWEMEGRRGARTEHSSAGALPRI